MFTPDELKEIKSQRSAAQQTMSPQTGGQEKLSPSDLVKQSVDQPESGLLEGSWDALKAGVGSGAAAWKTASDAYSLGEPFAIAMTRRVLPNDWVNKFSPLRGIVPLPSDEQQSEYAKGFAGEKPKESRNSVKNFINDIAFSVGDGMTMPGVGAAKTMKMLGSMGLGKLEKGALKSVLGGFERDLVTSVGAATGSELAGLGGESFAQSMTDDPEKIANARLGMSLLGGGVGGYALGPVRVNAMTQIGKGGVGFLGKQFGKLSDMKTAYKYAKEEAAKEENTRTMRQLFSDKMGQLKSEDAASVNKAMMKYMASAAQADPHMGERFKEMTSLLQKNGMTEDEIKEIFTPGQLTGNKALLQAEAEGATVIRGENIAKLQKAQAEREQAIGRAYEKEADPTEQSARSGFKRATGENPPSKTTVRDSMNAVRKYYSSVLDNMESRRSEISKRTPKLDSTEEDAIGSRVQGLQQEMKGDPEHGLMGKKNELYRNASSLLSAHRVNTNELKAMKNKLHGVVGNIFDLEHGDGLNEGSLAGVLAERQQVRRALGNLNPSIDATAASKRQALTQYDQALSKMLESKAEPEAASALRAADDFYGQTYAPMFASGSPGKIMLKSGRYGSGETKVKPSGVMSTLLGGENKADAANVREFEELFGGKLPGTVRNEEAYKILGRYLEGKFANSIKRGEITPDAYENFVSNYKPALNIAPDSAVKIADQFERLTKAQADIDTANRRMREIVGGPLTQSVGSDAAIKAMGNLLSDPTKMQFFARSLKAAEKRSFALGDRPKQNQYIDGFIREIYAHGNPVSNGEFDPSKLKALLNSGTPGLSILFRERYGLQQGDEHLSNLKKMANMMVNIKSTNVDRAHANVFEFQDPLESSTGSSVRNWTTRAMEKETGRAGVNSILAYLGTRFYKARAEAQFSKSVEESMLNPKKLNNIISMLDGAQNGRVDNDVLKDVLGASGKLANDIFVPDEWKVHFIRGLVSGKDLDQEKERQKREYPANR